MPKITFNQRTITVPEGTRLRDALLQNQLSPHHPAARYLNCHGMGTCGTCAVSIEGKTTPKTRVEKWRLNFPPHQEIKGLRLACQTRILSDAEVWKHDGFWGQKVD